MASQCWSSSSSQPKLPVVTIVSSSPATAASNGFVTSPPTIKTENPGFNIKGLSTPPTNGQILLSNLKHATSPTNSSVTSSETSSTDSPADYLKSSSIYGQILTRTLLQNSTPQQASDRPVSSTILTGPRMMSQTTVASIRSQTESPAGRSRESPVVLIVSAQQQPVAGRETSVPVICHRSSSQPSSPQNFYGAVPVGFPKDGSFGSPVSSSCVSPPEHFMSPSPLTVDSPASACNTGSPDTTEHTLVEADSCHSDNHSDKTTTPEKQQSREGVQSSPSKRKRVRKSRAKVQDPEQKIIVKKTRRVRANDRERMRMHGLNDAMDELRKHLPNDGNAGKLTKIDTLRTASNYIKILKMILVDFEKGENLTPLSSDIMTTVNNLYVQPAASPDSSGMTSPVHNNVALEDGRLQNCGVMPSGDMVVAGQFPCYQNQNYGFQDGYDPSNGINGAVPNVHHQLSGDYHGHNCNVNVSMLGNSSSSYSSVPVSNTISASYNVNNFALSAGNNMYNQQHIVNGHCSSSQSIFQQSSQCY